MPARSVCGTGHMSADQVRCEWVGPSGSVPLPPSHKQQSQMQENTTLHVDSGGDQASATFTLHNEDHTMGNTLRYMLNKNPAVSFVGYSVPHPAEAKMNLRLQTVGPPATEVLLDSLKTVHQVGEHVLATFDNAVEAHQRKQGAQPASMDVS